MELTEKALLFKEGHWTWTSLWQDIVLKIEKHFGHYFRDSDERSQFIAYVGPRIFNMVCRFSYYGKTIDALLFTSLRYQVRSFLVKRKKDNKARETYVALFDKEDLYGVAEPGLEFLEQPRPFGQARGRYAADDRKNKAGKKEAWEPEKGVQNLPVDTRRLLVAALKNPYEFDDRHLLRFSREFALPASWLFDRRAELRELLHPKRERLFRLREAYEALRLRFFSLTDTASSREKLGRRLENLRYRIKSAKVYSSHRDLAKVLGLPKGSVDSCLYYLRQGKGEACLRASGRVGSDHDTPPSHQQRPQGERVPADFPRPQDCDAPGCRVDL